MASRWLEQGARRLHLVDLNGAVAGKPAMKSPSRPSWMPWATRCRSRSAAASAISTPSRRYLDAGISYVIIGTAAVKNPGFLHDACGAFPGQIIVGLDARDGKIATDGWSKLTRHDVLDLAKKFEDYGCEAIIYTDIGRDGMLSGVNVDATVRLAQHVRIPVYASGGIAGIQDIEALCAVEEEGVEGAILGRSIYEGTLDFQAAQARADELSK